MRVPQEAVDITSRWEGFHKALPDGRAKPYQCSAKVWTVGWGTTYYLDGTKVKPTDEPITKDVARQLLLRQLESPYAATVDRVVKVKIHPLMRAALISLCYNIGGAALAKSTLIRLVNEKRWAECPAAFRKYRIGGGRVLAGLEARRKDEAALFMRGVAKLGEVPTKAPAPTQKAAVSGGDGRPSWWAQVAQGFLNGIKLGQSGTPAPA